MKINSLFNLFGTALVSIALSCCACSSGDTHCDAPGIGAYQEGLPFEMPVLSAPSFPDYTVSVADFGGVGDGMADCSEAFAKAMADVSSHGGGHLVVPRGVWCTGPITMESNVDLHLEDAAVILFSDDFDKYPIIDTYFEGLKTRRCMSPLNAEGKENIAITGFGTIDGNGDAWRWVKRGKLTDGQWRALQAKGGVTNEKGDIWFPTEGVKRGYDRADMNVVRDINSDDDWLAIRDYLRPVLLSFRNCKNVLLQGVCFQNSPAWNLHPFMCENVIINNVMVINPWYSQNGDGLDIEACKNVLVADSKFDVGDDAICIKSGKDQDGRDLQTPCQNVVVDGCAVYHGHGGFVVGSEMSSGVRNVSVRNCMFLGTDVGLRFKSTRGRGGVVENIYIDNINMINIPTDAILFDLYYNGKSASETLADGDVAPTDVVIPEVTMETPCFRNIYIDNVTCLGALRAMYFNGLPEMPVTNINVSNSQFTATNGIELNESDSVTIKNVVLKVENEEPLKTHNVKHLNVNGLSANGKSISDAAI